MADGEKGSIAGELIKDIPAKDRELFGREAGQALVNLAEAANAVSSWLKPIAAGTRAVAALFGRLTLRRRSIPPDRRLPPPTNLLLRVAPSYAASPDELRVRWENLLTRAMDRETAGAAAHPAYVRILEELSPLEVRIFDLFGALEELYESYAALGASLGSTEPETEIAIENLSRLGLICEVPTSGVPLVPLGPEPFVLRVKTPLVFVKVTSLPPGPPPDFVLRYSPTALGIGFHDACSNLPWRGPGT